MNALKKQLKNDLENYVNKHNTFQEWWNLQFPQHGINLYEY